MGRSLGSIPAIEIAHYYQEELKGLIIESGPANFSLLFNYCGIRVEGSIKNKIYQISNKAKIRSVRIPTLIIHAEYDQIIPLREGIELYENAGAKDKRFLVIPNADHNNLMLVGKDLYFDTIEEFVKAYENLKSKECQCFIAL